MRKLRITPKTKVIATAILTPTKMTILNPMLPRQSLGIEHLETILPCVSMFMQIEKNNSFVEKKAAAKSF